MPVNVLVDKSWTVGGYEVDPSNSDQWRQWRDILVAKELEEQVRAVFDECEKLIFPITGDHTTHHGFRAKMLLEEACVNLWGHGKRGSPRLPSDIGLRITKCEAGHHNFLLRTQDDQPVFDIGNLPDPTFDENLCEVTGRGILLMRRECRAIIRQASLDTGGKSLEYEWRLPEYPLEYLGLPETPGEPSSA